MDVLSHINMSTQKDKTETGAYDNACLIRTSDGMSWKWLIYFIFCRVFLLNKHQTPQHTHTHTISLIIEIHSLSVH